jgi:hypothetical protein
VSFALVTVLACGLIAGARVLRVPGRAQRSAVPAQPADLERS